jgi:hypothetical protein
MIFGKGKQIEALREERERLRARIRELEKAGKGRGPAGVPLQELAYNSDGLSVWGKNLAFLEEERFRRAYLKGAGSGHRFTSDLDAFHIEWRVHIILWASGIGLRLEGDFVECGVNTGIFSLAIADYHDFASSGRKFYLFDTFCGTPEEQMSDEEKEKRLRDNEFLYPDCYDLAKSNFAPYPNIELVRGRVPETLEGAGIGKVAYLSIDMNVAEAERAAIEYFWDRLVPGAPVVLDDYGWVTCEMQKAALDDFAAGVGTSIATLPTGQGLMFKC